MNDPTISIDDFSSTLFWDVDKTQIDLEENAPHIIEKVMNRGTWEDFYKRV